MPNQIKTLDWNDTFLHLTHLKSSNPGYKVLLAPSANRSATTDPPPPYRITTGAGGAKGKEGGAKGPEGGDKGPEGGAKGQEGGVKGQEGGAKEEEERTLTVEAHVIPNRGPYIYNQPKRFAQLSQKFCFRMLVFSRK